MDVYFLIFRRAVRSTGIPWLLAVAVLGLVSSLPAKAQERPVLPSERNESVQTVEAVPRHEMPAVDVEGLDVTNTKPTGRVDPYRYGAVVETRLTSTRNGLWERLPSGDWLWRLRLHSEGASSLSVGFRHFDLPDGAILYVHDLEQGTIRGPYTSADATAGEHWTPFVRGSDLVIEMQVPRGQRAEVDIEVGQVVHGYRPIRPGATSGVPSKSGACNVDVACEQADPWTLQVRSVGRYSYVDNGAAFLCSGSLVNNTAEDKTPYFLTAEHCISTPQNASSMVFYWNYQNSTCRTRGTSENGTVTDDSPDDQTSSGAVLRARYGNYHDQDIIRGKPDISLVEVDDSIPSSYQLFFSGWSRRGMGADRGVTIHHPAGHGKRISFEDDPLAKTAYGESGGGETHLRVGDWDLGTTEAGSSGGPLYNSNQKVIGVLSGGLAGCETSSSANDNDLPDWYGRVAPAFETGDYQNSTLADWLDPLGTGADTLGGIPQVENLDVIAPAAVRDLHVEDVNTSNQTVSLEWVATGDDNRQGTASAYDLRFDTTRIDTPANFEGARRVTDLKSPTEAGRVEHIEVDGSDGLQADTPYYFAVVAVDESGNRSPHVSTAREVVLVKDIEIAPGGFQAGSASSTSETRFVVNRTQDVRIVIYDLLGRRIRVLFDRRVEEGFQQIVQFDTSQLASGPYFLRFVGETFATTRKIVVVR